VTRRRPASGPPDRAAGPAGAADRTAAPAEATGDRPAPSGEATGDRPASSGDAIGDRPAPPGDAAGGRPASSGDAAGDRPASSGDAAGGRPAPSGLLGPAQIRALAAELGVSPTKTLGQNFVIDPNTVRRIAAAADLTADDVVVEVGPGLGSLTLALLPAARRLYAVEIDPRLADRLPATIAAHAPAHADRLRVLAADALRIDADAFAEPPTALVANLPYNVAVPVLLHLLAQLPTLAHGLVMVQQEVADRLTAGPGSRTYGVPSAKLAWYAAARPAGSVGRSVFWPVPNVDSGLVAFTRHDPPAPAVPAEEVPRVPVPGEEVPRVAVPGEKVPPAVPGEMVSRQAVFAVVDAAFAQRRKTLRAALARWAGSPARAEQLLRAADVAPSARGESLTIADFTRIAAAAAADRPPS
jgi:16S rRNA (adenine1518-N6/adenine1519-N6)-dimethyltransferase